MSESVLGITMPQDFPSESWLKFQKQSAKWFPNGSDTHQLVAGGWNGLAYRYVAMDNSYRKLIASLTQNPSGMPSHLERHHEETALFTFTSAAVSSVECGFFGLNGLCSTKWAKRFPVKHNKLRSISPQSVCSALGRIDELRTSSVALKAALKNEQYVEVYDLRNLLNHRAAPSRKGFVSLGTVATRSEPAVGLGMFTGISFTEEYFDQLRNGVSETVRSLVDECTVIATRYR